MCMTSLRAAPILDKTEFRHSTSALGSVSWVKKFCRSPNQAYEISKAALHMLNAQYALAHADAGFTFLCVSPGVSTYCLVE